MSSNEALKFGQIKSGASKQADHYWIGIRFGWACIDLKAELKNNEKAFKQRLEELGISYDKAIYWMPKAEHRTDIMLKHSKKPSARLKNTRSPNARPN